MPRSVFLSLAFVLAVPPACAAAQQIPPGTANVHLQSHLPLGGEFSVGDIEIEQELSRPYVYVTRTWSSPGFDLISVKDPARPQLLLSWQIENPELHAGLGGSDGQYFKHRGRYYYAARAVTRGQFMLAPLEAEVMYDPEVKSVNGARVVRVR